MSYKLRYLCFLAIILLLGGCQGVNLNNQTSVEEENQEEEVSWSEKYDSEDTGILLGIDEKKQSITIKKVESGEKIRLSYKGATNVADKYQNTILMNQIEIGDLVNVYYTKEDSVVKKIEISPDAWGYTDVERLTYDQTEKSITIAGEKYRYSDDFTLLSDGKEVTFLDLDPIDVVTVKGINKKIYSVVVTRGHGYITLENDETFIDGWIEVGGESVKPITENMTIVASEGNHKVTVAKDGAGGTKNVTVKRNEKIVMDVGDLKSETPKQGSLKFTITPSDASLYIDGVKTDYSELVVLDYGAHRIVVKVDGKSNYSQTIVVGSSYAEIEINAGGTSSSSSDNKGSEDSKTDKNNSSTNSNGSGTTNSDTNNNSSNTNNTNNTNTNNTSNGTNNTNTNNTNINNNNTNNTNLKQDKNTEEDEDTKASVSDSLDNVLTDVIKDILN